MLAAVLFTAVAWGADGDNDSVKKEIVKSAEAFCEAFNKGDAHALAQFWTPNGMYRDIKNNDTKGREALEKKFAAFFKENKGLKLRIDIENMRPVTDDVVIEEGTSQVLHPDGSPPSLAHYVILHVKKDGQWYLDVVKDSVYLAPSNYKHLSSLEWLIGEWADTKGKDTVARLAFSWGPNQNYITGTYAGTYKNITLSSGTMWICWDAANKQIRTWTFDNDGGFGDATWTKKGDQWTIKRSTTTPDGKKGSATVQVTIVDPQTITMQSSHRSVDGQPLPDMPEVTLKRVNNQ
jgi:uncharacterized protein (TIGR02246 family)